MARKYKMLVTVQKEIEVELTDSVFGGMTEEDYLAEFRRGLWHVDSMKDVAEHAGRMAFDGCGSEHDGLGLVDAHYSKYPRPPDVKVWVHNEDIEVEMLTIEAAA